MKKTETKRTNYVQAAIVVGFISILGILALSYIRPEDDILTLSAVTFTFISLVYNTIKVEQTRVVSEDTKRQSMETHDMVNSRLTEYIETQEKLWQMRGERIGRERERERSEKGVTDTQELVAKTQRRVTRNSG